MDFNSLLKQVLFTIGEREFMVIHVVSGILAVAGIFVLNWALFKFLLPRYFDEETLKSQKRGSIKRRIRAFFFLLILLAIIWGFDLDYVLYENINFSFSVITLVNGLLIIQLARILDWVISSTLIHNFYKRHDSEIAAGKLLISTPEKSANRTVKYVLAIFVIIIFLEGFDFSYTIFSYSEFELTFSKILGAVLIILVAQMIVWITTQIVLHYFYRRDSVNAGSVYAINQLIKYIVFLFAIFIIVDNLGVRMTVIWGGLAALLVGIGLGLQQTFNDLLSGILLLFERSVEIEDVVEIDGLIGTVKKIGLRASIVNSRENIWVIVPNSKLVTSNVINWSHSDKKIRFFIAVKVAYGTNTQTVKKLLIEAAKTHSKSLKQPAPFVRFTGYGEYALNFELHFWSKQLMAIEDVQSDIRFEIDRLFRENNIHIPFPQRDIWFKNKQE